MGPMMGVVVGNSQRSPDGGPGRQVCTKSINLQDGDAFF